MDRFGIELFVMLSFTKERMQKQWVIGVAAMLVVYAVVATTAFAVFGPEAQLSGLIFSTASPSLKLAPDSTSAPITSSFQPTLSFSGASTMYPGMPVAKERFWLMNGSTGEQKLNVVLKVIPGDQDWSFIRNLIQINILDIQTGSETGYIALGDLESYPWPFPNVYLISGEKRRFEIQYSIPETYPLDPDGDGPISASDPIGSEAMGKVTSNVKFVIDGTIEEMP